MELSVIDACEQRLADDCATYQTPRLMSAVGPKQT